MTPNIVFSFINSIVSSPRANDFLFAILTTFPAILRTPPLRVYRLLVEEGYFCDIFVLNLKSLSAAYDAQDSFFVFVTKAST